MEAQPEESSELGDVFDRPANREWRLGGIRSASP